MVKRSERVHEQLSSNNFRTARDIANAETHGVQRGRDRQDDDWAGPLVDIGCYERNPGEFPIWEREPYQVPSDVVCKMRISDRLNWLCDLFRLRHDDPDKSCTHILNALEAVVRTEDPEWKTRKLWDDK